MADDFEVIDFEALEECLIEEAALGWAGLSVGSLDVFGHGERDLDGVQEPVVIDAQLGDHLGSGDVLAGNAFLLAVVESLGDPLGVVALQQLALLPLQAAEGTAGAGDLGVSDAGQLIQVCSHETPNALALAVGELDAGVVALDSSLDVFDAVPALLASALLASAANEVVVLPAVAAYPHKEQPALALAAKEGTAQVGVVAPAALAALALGGEHLLHESEHLRRHQRLVASPVGLAVVVDDPDVIVVA